MAADRADVVDDSHHCRKVSRCRRSQGPDLRCLEQKPLVEHAGDTGRDIGKTAASDAEEFIWSKITYVHIPVFHIDHAVGRVLHGVADHVDIRIDLMHAAGDLLDVHNVAGDVGSSHHADQHGVFVNMLQDFLNLDAAGFGIGRNLTELPAGADAGVRNRVMG